MNKPAVIRFLVPVLLALAPFGAQACGELRFNAGRGLPFQSYIATRPADVLVVRGAAVEEGYLEALEAAGHHLTIVASAGAVAAELGRQHYDVVIAGYEALEAVSPQVDAASSSPRLLPVVERALRKDPVVTRFGQVLLDTASIGQYLTVINKLVTR
jgi:hypothetical protein